MSETATPPCVTAVPGEYGNVPVGACNSNYNYDPNFGAAVLFAVLFSICAVIHIALAFIYKKAFSWVIIMGVLWESGSFITRSLGARDQQNTNLVIADQVLLFLAPLCELQFLFFCFKLSFSGSTG